jgi:hypothetical protein|tara:strand:+ start:526 stop:708 length:183 start_codon:yes stop_codon:yes gene_type:complete
MLKATRKDVFFKYLDKWDAQFIDDYMVDHTHYWNNDRHNLLADWEKEDYESIKNELYWKS